MPLVTLTCSRDYYPPEEFNTRIARRQIALDLASQLPLLIIDKADELGLTADTSIDAVQVDIKQFHPRSVNSPDLWIKVELSESCPENALDVRNGFIAIIDEFMEAQRHAPTRWALDIFWGPSHGKLLLNGSESITFTW